MLLIILLAFSYATFETGREATRRDLDDEIAELCEEAGE